MDIEYEDHEDKSLYRAEYVDFDNSKTVEWVWLGEDDVEMYRSSYNSVKTRLATEDETLLYEEAYSDGYGMAAMLEFESSYDGVTFRVELDGNGNLDMQGTKMFECAVCGAHKDFETEVAMANDLYLGVVKEDKLWHVCFECAMIGSAIGGIQLEEDFIEGEDESR